MSEPLTCPTCGHWTRAGKDMLAKKAREHPIFGVDFSKPTSKSIEDIRHVMATLRGRLSDIGSAYPGWGESTKNVEGLLTCGLIALHQIMREMQEVEAKQAAAEREPPAGPGVKA